MTTAAVGFQCPDCVQEGKKSVRAVRTVFGGRVHDGRPLVTYALMAACAVVGVLQIVIPGFTQDFSMWPLRVAFFDQWYRMITSGFLHYGVVHLLFNMWALYVVGPPLESWLGRARFSVLYGVSLLGGSTLIYLMAPLNTAHAGASGAIFGLFAATYVVAKRLQFDVRSVTMLIVLNLVITFAIPGISWQGHVGGLITGALIACAYAFSPERYRTLFHVGVPVALLAVFVTLTVWRTEQLRSLITIVSS